jgi:hypothetical protein
MEGALGTSRRYYAAGSIVHFFGLGEFQHLLKRLEWKNVRSIAPSIPAKVLGHSDSY